MLKSHFDIVLPFSANKIQFKQPSTGKWTVDNKQKKNPHREFGCWPPYRAWPFNPFTPTISILILLTVYHTLLMLVLRIWCLIKQYPLVDFFFILITCLLDNVMILQGEITYWSLLGVKGSIDSRFIGFDCIFYMLLKLLISCSQTLTYTCLS